MPKFTIMSHIFFLYTSQRNRKLKLRNLTSFICAPATTTTCFLRSLFYLQFIATTVVIYNRRVGGEWIGQGGKSVKNTIEIYNIPDFLYVVNLRWCARLKAKRVKRLKISIRFLIKNHARYTMKVV